MSFPEVVFQLDYNNSGMDPYVSIDARTVVGTESYDNSDPAVSGTYYRTFDGSSCDYWNLLNVEGVQPHDKNGVFPTGSLIRIHNSIV